MRNFLILALVLVPLVIAFQPIHNRRSRVRDDEYNIKRRIVRTKLAPTPIGPYNQGIQIDDILYISGTLGIDPLTNQLVPGGIVNETRQALINIGQILAFTNSTFFNVFRVTVMLADVNDFAQLNTVYAEFFTEKYPARAVYQAAALLKGARVEIEAIAAVGNITDIIS